MTTSCPPDLNALIDILYEASLNPERLPDFLRGLAAEFGTEFAHFLVRHRDDRRFVINVMAGFDGNEPARFEQDYAFKEEQAPWLNGSSDSFRQTSYFRDRLRLHGIGEGLWIDAEDGDGRCALVGLFRRVGAPPFGTEDLSRLEGLRAHLPHALRLLTRLTELEARCDILHGIAAGMLCASIVTDAAAQVAYATPGAEELLEAGDGVALAGRVLQAAMTRQTRELHDHIRRVARAARDGDVVEARQAGMSLERPGGARALTCVIRPLANRTGVLNGAKPLVHIHLAPPERIGVPAPSLLRGLFGLTQAEAALLQALMQDKRIEEFAEERGVAVTTVRTQLAHLFRKTDTNRQSELVRLAILAAGVLSER